MRRYRQQQKPPVNPLSSGTETNVSYHVTEPPTSQRSASSSDFQPDAGLQSYYVNAGDIDPTLTDFDSLRTVASGVTRVSKADSRSSGYQSVEGSVWDVMSFDNPLFRAFSFRGSGRRQLVSSPGSSTQSTV